MFRGAEVSSPLRLLGLLAAAGLSTAGKDASPYANSDAVYQQLREAAPTESFIVENHRMERDAHAAATVHRPGCPIDP